MVYKDKILKAKSQGHRKKSKSRFSAVEESLVRELANDGLRIEEMDGDGNCMFRCIGHQLYGDPERHLEVRKHVLDCVESHQEHFEAFIDDDETFSDYIDRMREPGEWGDNLELYAACMCYGVNIYIHQADMATYVISSQIHTSKFIRLSFHGDCHYNSVVAMEGGLPPKPVASAVDHAAPPIYPEYLVKQVSMAVPWVGEEEVMKALKQAGGEVDGAIECLCGTVEGLELGSAHDASNKIKTDDYSATADTNETQPLDEIGKGASENISRVERRKSQKHLKREERAHRKNEKKSSLEESTHEAQTFSPTIINPAKLKPLSKKQQRKKEKQQQTNKDQLESAPLATHISVQSPDSPLRQVIAI
eukprot:gene30715-37114_t